MIIPDSFWGMTIFKTYFLPCLLVLCHTCTISKSGHFKLLTEFIRSVQLPIMSSPFCNPIFFSGCMTFMNFSKCPEIQRRTDLKMVSGTFKRFTRPQCFYNFIQCFLSSIQLKRRTTYFACCINQSHKIHLRILL